jgi:hypothetical protein
MTLEEQLGKLLGINEDGSLSLNAKGKQKATQDLFYRCKACEHFWFDCKCYFDENVAVEKMLVLWLAGGPDKVDNFIEKLRKIANGV